ncbi:unnamed protein product [Cylicocyclus nassatus]|uniref:N-acetylgalactosaminide beta-1,3-galactosyltransferase n=1 Tax=Cylicocyclus nassatus TaxID=53992 RepID=A0AA36DQP9_CYLNA|nr:unnamed protein product [Cylicocyclus nassatus]
MRRSRNTAGRQVITTDIPYVTVFAGIPDTYANLFYKSHYAFYYIYEYISKEFEWYMKKSVFLEADDDTYIIVEHLKRYLSTLNPNKPYYLGHLRKRILKHGYNSGGAYILSKAALKLYNELAYQNKTKCPDAKNEDVGIGSMDIYPHDTRNSKGQNRFNSFTPSDIFHSTGTPLDRINYGEKKGYEAFASDLISFHHLTPDDMRLFDILLYRLDKP